MFVNWMQSIHWSNKGLGRRHRQCNQYIFSGVRSPLWTLSPVTLHVILCCSIYLIFLLYCLLLFSIKLLFSLRFTWSCVLSMFLSFSVLLLSADLSWFVLLVSFVLVKVTNHHHHSLIVLCRCRIMMLSVLQNTKSPVKFWFLKNYLSPNFKVRHLLLQFFIMMLTFLVLANSLLLTDLLPCLSTSVNRPILFPG